MTGRGTTPFGSFDFVLQVQDNGFLFPADNYRIAWPGYAAGGNVIGDLVVRAFNP